MRGFSGAKRSGIGGRTRWLDWPCAVRLAAGLALYLAAGRLACAQDFSRSLEAPARLAFDMASVQANVVEATERMLGLEVGEVNVFVSSVAFAS